MGAARRGSGRKTVVELGRAGRLFRDLPWETVGVPIAVVAVCVFFSLVSPHFMRLENLTNIGRQTAAMALIAWGETVIILRRHRPLPGRGAPGRPGELRPAAPGQ